MTNKFIAVLIFVLFSFSAIGNAGKPGMIFIGSFTNMKFDNEHAYGSEVELWKDANDIFGLFLHSEGLASGYGESVLKAFIVFAVLIGLFTIGYKNSDFDPMSKTAIIKPMPAAASSSPDIPDIRPRRLGWREAALYSFNVSILQKPEPKPLGLWGTALVSLETVLGPAQAALLALALRRRFMR